tara:strand:+ start:8888 stop:9643 length:756 start_codon:yes stop_codon:yes gene_type:complete
MTQKYQNKTQKYRIAKVIARTGAYSRREAERMISDRNVTMNGEVVTSPVTMASFDDDIYINKIKIPNVSKTKIWILNKPKGFITTANDPQNRNTVFKLVPKATNHLIPIGRLDINTEGLLLFTNDGQLSRYMEHPSNKIIRKYKIEIDQWVADDITSKILGEIQIDGYIYNIAQCKLLSNNKQSSWLTIEIAEGKNREIRKICKHFNLRILRLIRISYGPFDLGNIQKGETLEVKYDQMKAKLNKIGYKIN